MTMPRRQQSKLNDSGFSLVELLVGVAILVMVLGPLLYSFVVSQRISRNSHTLGEATLISRNIVETIRTTGVSRVVSAAATDTDADGVLDTIDDTATLFGGALQGGSVNVADGVYTFEVSGINAGELGNTRLGSAGNVQLDAIVTIDARPYRTQLDNDGNPIYLDAGGNPIYTPHYKFNAHEVIDYRRLDGMFVQPVNYIKTTETGDAIEVVDDPDSLAALSFTDDLHALGVPEIISGGGGPDEYTSIDLARSIMERKITIEAQMETEDEVTIIVRYSYRIPAGTYPYAGGAVTILPELIPVYEHPPFYDVYFDKYDPDDPKPVSVYIFYRPHYGGSVDEIEIINLGHGTSRFDLTVFLVRQPPSGISEAQFMAGESAYRSTINQREDYSLWTSGPTINASTTIYSNFKENLYRKLNNPDYNPLTDVILEANHYVYYTPVLRKPGALSSNALVSKAQRDRMYNILVEVYNAGEAGTGALPLLSFDATHLD